MAVDHLRQAPVTEKNNANCRMIAVIINSSARAIDTHIYSLHVQEHYQKVRKSCYNRRQDFRSGPSWKEVIQANDVKDGLHRSIRVSLPFYVVGP